MLISEHMNKADRIARSMDTALEMNADYELFVEACMLSGNHMLNAVLHHLGSTTDREDLLHSDKPPLPQIPSARP